MSIRNPKSIIRNPLTTLPRRVLVLVGPTASGKTSVSIELAGLLDGEIISADSRQVFKHLDIGTAKPSKLQLSSVKHYFVDMLLPDEDFNAGEFGERGRKVIDEIFEKRKTPIVVGGSGLYVQSLINGLFDGPAADTELREVMERRVSEGNLPELIAELRRVDSLSAERIDLTKPRRIIRALEVFHATGKPISEHHAESKIEINFAPLLFGLEWDRYELYQRIDQRCEDMLKNGLLQEVEELKKRGYGPRLNALNTVGYAEAFDYMSGEISYDEMVRLFKQNSRRYAKRQMTWFRRDKRIRWIQMNENSDLLATAEIIAESFRKH